MPKGRVSLMVCFLIFVACTAPMERPILRYPEPLERLDEKALPSFSDDMTAQSL